MKEVIIILSIISTIESGNNPNAYNPKAGAVGLFQITPICLKEYNQYHWAKYTRQNLYDPKINRKIASWYLQRRIPQMLKYYGYKITVENVLICYNWGIGNFIRWKQGRIKKLPRETREYVRKYFELLKRR